MTVIVFCLDIAEPYMLQRIMHSGHPPTHSPSPAFVCVHTNVPPSSHLIIPLHLSRMFSFYHGTHPSHISPCCPGAPATYSSTTQPLSHAIVPPSTFFFHHAFKEPRKPVASCAPLPSSCPCTYPVSTPPPLTSPSGSQDRRIDTGSRHLLRIFRRCAHSTAMPGERGTRQRLRG